MSRIFVLLSIFASFSTSAWAYVPPSNFILKQLVAKHHLSTPSKGKTHVILIKSFVTRAEKTSGDHFKEETFFYPEFQQLVSRALDDSGGELYRAEKKAQEMTAADLLLFGSSAAETITALKSEGVPIRTEEELLAMKDEQERINSETEYLSRLGGSVAWVLGSKAKKKATSQLWVEKDGFLPLRLLLADPDGEVRADIQFDGYRFSHDFPFPRAISFTRASGPVLKDEISDFAVSASVTPKVSEANGFTDLGKAVPATVQDLIQQYYGHIR